MLEWGPRLPKYRAMASLSHRQGWSFAVLVVLFPCFLSARSNEGSTTPTYRVGTSEVRVIFFATDERNRRLDTIDKNDFAIIDGENIVRDFRSLTRANETTLDIVVLVDTSESVAPRFRSTIDQILSLISHAAPADSLAMITFAGVQPAVVCASDCSAAAAEQRIRALHPTGATPLFDALTFSARYLADRRRPNVRQVLLLFSDGNDTISGTSARQALDAVTESGVILYTINPNKPDHDAKAAARLEEMSAATGGRSFSTPVDATDILQAVLADWRACYVVTYPPPSHDAGFHSLRILPKHNLNLRFHSRKGYFYDEVR